MAEQLRAAVYARFSTDKQRDASIEDQVDSCRDFARTQGWIISEVYSDEAMSGSSMFRPGIERLQRDARAGKFNIVVSEGFDRLSRSLADVSKFFDRMEHVGVEIWTITELKVDKMVITLKSMMNEVALRDTGLKTRRGQKGRAKLGMVAGGNSYGYDALPGTSVNGKMEYGLKGDQSGRGGDRALHLCGICEGYFAKEDRGTTQHQGRSRPARRRLGGIHPAW